MGGVPFDLEGNMIILTGASGGIGRALVADLAKLDDVIAIHSSSELKDFKFSNVFPVKLDITSSDAISRFINEYSDQLTQVTLVHSAAVSRDNLAATLDVEDYQTVVDVNLRGNFLLTKGILPTMIREKWGRIIHLSSIAGLRGEVGTLAYSTSKSGLIGMSRVLAKEYGRFNVTSNVLALGYFDNGLINTLTKKAVEQIVASVPSRKLGSPTNITKAVDFLIKADYVNGATINIDGGI